MKQQLGVLVALTFVARMAFAQDASVDATTTDVATTDTSAQDASIAVDSGSTDSGTTDSRTDGGATWPTNANPVDALVASRTAYGTTWCGCFRGTATAEQCIQELSADSNALMCTAARYNVVNSNTRVRTQLDCAAWAWNEAVACIRALGTSCGTWSDSACESALTDRLGLCPDLMQGDITTAARQAEDQCATMRLVGSGGACPNSAEVSTMVGDGVFTGTTRGAADNTAPNGTTCSDGRGGADAAFRWRAPSSGIFTFTTNATFDAILYARRACADAEDLGCSDDPMAADMDEVIRITAQQGEEFVIIIDGFAPSDLGSFGINIARTGSIRDAGTDAGAPPPAARGGCSTSHGAQSQLTLACMMLVLGWSMTRRRSR